MRRETLEKSSSQVRATAYDADTQIFEVEFRSGGVYQYANVTPEERDTVLDAESVGGALNAIVKGSKPCTRVHGCCGEPFDGAAVTHACAVAV